jgi:hypothetical protein
MCGFLLCALVVGRGAWWCLVWEGCTGVWHQGREGDGRGEAHIAHTAFLNPRFLNPILDLNVDTFSNLLHRGKKTCIFHFKMLPFPTGEGKS